jgi:hypothetical protein
MCIAPEILRWRTMFQISWEHLFNIKFDFDRWKEHGLGEIVIDVE